MPRADAPAPHPARPAQPERPTPRPEPDSKALRFALRVPLALVWLGASALYFVLASLRPTVLAPAEGARPTVTWTRHAPTLEPDARARPPAAKAQSLAEAIALATGLMADAVDTPSEGARMLAEWLRLHGRFADVYVAAPELSFAAALAGDPTARGKRLCFEASVHTLVDGQARVWLDRPDGTHAHVALAGPRAPLEVGDRVTVCGVVTGRLARLREGHLDQAVDLVGMLDQPSDREAPR
jgi:hypothetical protein